MEEIHYIDRTTKEVEVERIYGEFFIRLLYGRGLLTRLFSAILLPLCRWPLFSHFYGLIQKSPFSRVKIRYFIKKYGIDASEFALPVEKFGSFNDFFIRKLKKSARPIAAGGDIATLPADGRYLVYPNIQQSDGFLVKGERFTLEELLHDKMRAHKYEQGGMVFARLCPVDYHRFHFPSDCVPGASHLINGPLYSVNPLALRKNIEIFAQNKRMITELNTQNFGTILFIEIGATYVGSIQQTYTPGLPYAKGDEKGYFEFGSSLILLFEPFRIQFDQDLIEASLRRTEIRGLLGQSLGRSLKN